ncbi:MAG TPA: NnrS family protein [Polyangiales bacterium]|nr:NnrS family protein [Polyangiales bacterium]
MRSDTHSAVESSGRLPLIGQGPRPDAHQPPLLAIGFRPFFLLAALAALLLVPCWLFVLLTGSAWLGALPPALWHAHEMLFGYTSAVIAGFLLTAVQNWTGQPSARGPLLLALVVLWSAGRAVAFAGANLPAVLAAGIDLAFLPALALCVARPIGRTRNTRNAGMPVLLLVLAAANGLYWAGSSMPDALALLRGQRIALDVIAMLILVIGGRVIPGFTGNAVKGLSIRSRNALDMLGVAALAGLLVLDAAAPRSQAAAYGAALAGLLNVLRLYGWGGARALGRPILAVLHTGFACTALALLLRGYALATGALTESTATHLLTVGGIGLMTLGMMARVALGHTGRQLTLHTSIVAAIAALALSALVRVLGAVLVPHHYATVLIVAGALWALAFGLYLIHYTPILIRPRVDGKLG